MLPTITLNPTATATGTSASGSANRKRDVSETLPYGRLPVAARQSSRLLDPDTWWWFGVGATALGGVAYFAF